MFPISKKFIKLLNECDIEYTSAPADDDIDTDMINLTYFESCATCAAHPLSCDCSASGMTVCRGNGLARCSEIVIKMY